MNQHTVIKGLDIYERVGRAVGHDEYIPFRVNDNQLLLDGETLPFAGSIYVEFLKVHVNSPNFMHWFRDCDKKVWDNIIGNASHPLLRFCGLDYMLPEVSSKRLKHTFVNRCLFKQV